MAAHHASIQGTSRVSPQAGGSSPEPLQREALSHCWNPELAAQGLHVLHAANLPDALLANCSTALRKNGRLFSPSQTCARLFLAWTGALSTAPQQQFFPAVIAGDMMVAGYDLLDQIYDHDDWQHARSQALPTGITLLHLAAELLARLDLPAERRTAAAAAMSHGGRHAFAGHLADYSLRSQAAAEPSLLLSIARQRSGSLIAATCSMAALLAGGSWREVGLSRVFGRAFAVAAQLEDDVADTDRDALAGRQTLPLALSGRAPAEVASAAVWVLRRRSLLQAAAAVRAIERLRAEAPLEHLWALLPADLRS